MNLCTLFDSNYIDRALVMYDSLTNVCDNFVLFVIAFDEPCLNALRELDPAHMTVIYYDEFEDNELRKAKSNRSRREFLWTCSGYCIRYLMKRYNLSDLTYIDSDLYFYSSPERALNSFLDSNCDAAIISHRFSNHPENIYTAETYGKYCVEFNTFKNTPNGMVILNWWINKCIECCTETAKDGLFGDQKYLDMFKELFEGVYVYDDFGMGIAPWNIDEYVQKGDLIKNKLTHECGKLVFYHYHSLDVFPDGSSNIRVFIRPGHHDKSLVESLYKPYIKKLLIKRQLLYARFGLFDTHSLNSATKIHEGELKTFLTCEPNLLFLIRKLWRYLLHKGKDYIKVQTD